jgi:hypothetical protein
MGIRNVISASFLLSLSKPISLQSLLLSSYRPPAPSITDVRRYHSRHVAELMSSMWNKVAGQLSEKYTVVCADLRGKSIFPLSVFSLVIYSYRDNIAREELIEGYGRSSKPPGSTTHIEYSKRELANDLVQLMSHFKFEKFNILAHDRGARVAHRLALDHPGSVEKVVLLDIAPTLWMYEQTDMAFVSTPHPTLSLSILLSYPLSCVGRHISNGMA